MVIKHPPVVGDWYRNPNGEIFEIVAYDEDDQTVELQYFDGTVEELDLDTWNELVIEATEQPEDWSGSLDIEKEDYGVDLDQAAEGSNLSPLDKLDNDR